jgi:predicted nucleic acid-binding Zn finger protein
MLKKEADYHDVLAALERVGSSPSEALRVFDLRGFEAWQIVKDRRVKKYVFQPSGRVQWVVVGEGRDYMIYDAVGYCHCEDFYHAVMNGEALACKHLIAQRLALNLNLFETVEESDDKYLVRLSEWRRT